MKAYKPEQPLYSLHIPKCGGQSLKRLLRQWFDERFFNHYFSDDGGNPDIHAPVPKSCVHGHFNQRRGVGLRTYYPDAGQFITVLRDPLEREISNYFYWKRNQRRRMIDQGLLVPGSQWDHDSLDDFISKIKSQRIMRYLPEDMNESNFPEYVDRHFIWVGVVDTLERDIPILAERLGFAPVDFPHVNKSSRNEKLSPEVRDAFLERHGRIYELIDIARSLNA